MAQHRSYGDCGDALRGVWLLMTDQQKKERGKIRHVSLLATMAATIAAGLVTTFDDDDPIPVHRRKDQVAYDAVDQAAKILDEVFARIDREYGTSEGS